MEKKAKRILTVSGILAAGTAVLGGAYRAVTECFVNMALSRELPRYFCGKGNRLSGSSMDARISERIAAAAERLENSGCETVQITARDGTELMGHWRKCTGTKRVIIAMHGWRSSWKSDFGIVSDFWNDNSCSVLYAEQRGQGGSGGEYMGFGLTERFDCLDWITWVTQRVGTELPVYLAGISMGASTVLMAGGLELPENVHGIMADCGYTSADAIWKHVAENNLHLSYGAHRAAVEAMCRKKLQMDLSDASCVEALKRCRVPVLFVHGGADKFVPVEMGYENYGACASPKRLIVVPGAEHGMSYLVDKEGYEAAVKNFWQTYD